MQRSARRLATENNERILKADGAGIQRLALFDGFGVGCCLQVGAASCRAEFKAGYVTRKVDIRLPEKDNLDSHGARPVHLIITMR